VLTVYYAMWRNKQILIEKPGNQDKSLDFI
jgi:hypothetical protein